MTSTAGTAPICPQAPTHHPPTNTLAGLPAAACTRATAPTTTPATPPDTPPSASSSGRDASGEVERQTVSVRMEESMTVGASCSALASSSRRLVGRSAGVAPNSCKIERGEGGERGQGVSTERVSGVGMGAGREGDVTTAGSATMGGTAAAAA